MKRAILLAAICCMSKIALGSITFSFSGHLNESFTNPNNAIPGLVSGQPFSGWISYSFVPDSRDDTNEYGLFNQNASISVTVGDETYSYLNDYVYVRVTNSHEDAFQFVVDNELNEEISFSYFGIKLTDSRELAFDSDQLPSDLNLSDFNSSVFIMTGNRYNSSTDGRDSFSIQGTVTSLTLIPEPLTLITMALGGLFIRKKS